MRLTLMVAALVAALSPAVALAAEPIKIVAAENFYGDLAQQIGGDHVSVTSILSNPDDDPHLFEASPSTARNLANAAVVIYNGADYDAWMPKLLAASPSDKRTTIVAADLIGAKAGDNPHLWYKPATLPAVAKALASALEQRDPANAAVYAKNLKTFDAAFAKITDAVAAIRAKDAGLAVTATEPVFGYMAEALGFKMLNSAFQIAVMNDTEPSPAQVAAFEQSLTSGEAKILFYNSQVTDATTERMLKLAKTGKVTVIGVTETLPKDKTIETWFGGQLAEIKQALGKTTP